MIIASITRCRLRQKVFCVGANKTGTTSLGSFLGQLGYKVAPQAPAELLIEQWANRDFADIIKFCKSYDAFQDSPFSLPYTYQFLDQAFPKSKFILTFRGSSGEWYESLVRFTKKRLKIDHFPEWQDLHNDMYRYKGFTARVTKLIYGDDTPLFDKRVYEKSYMDHNKAVINYFMHRKKDLLVINLADVTAEARIRNFLGIPHDARGSLLHLNSSLSTAQS